MIKNSKHIFTTILFVVGIVFGQFSKSITINTYTDDNLFRTPDPIQDLLTNINLSLNYKLAETNTQFYNNINLLTYKNTFERNFLINSAGINKSIKFGENSTSKVNIGGNWTLRVNKNDYNYYNYSQMSGYANFQLLTDIVLMKGGYSYRWRNYSNLPELSNQLHNVYFQLNKSFPTRTTIILETGLGNKSFMGQDSFITVNDIGRGRGQHSTGSVSTNTISEQLSTSQAHIILRLTQSLHDNAGIYVQYRKQLSIDDETSYRNFDDYYQDDELFDDPFTYESDSYSSQLTLMLPKSTKLLFGGSLHSKNYISEQAYASAEDTLGINKLRFDEQTNYFMDISKTFHINKNWANSIKLNLYYSFTNNESNSYWYNYKNATFGGRIQWSF